MALLRRVLRHPLSIGAAWLAHTTLTDRLTRVDPIFLRINLLLLMMVGQFQSGSGSEIAGPSRASGSHCYRLMVHMPPRDQPPGTLPLAELASSTPVLKPGSRRQPGSRARIPTAPLREPNSTRLSRRSTITNGWRMAGARIRARIRSRLAPAPERVVAGSMREIGRGKPARHLAQHLAQLFGKRGGVVVW